MEATQQLYKYEVGYKVPVAGREGMVSVKAESVCQAQAKAVVAVSEKTQMAGLIIITSVGCKGVAK